MLMLELLVHVEIFRNEKTIRFNFQPWKKHVAKVLWALLVMGLLLGFIGGIWYWYAATDSGTWSMF